MGRSILGAVVGYVVVFVAVMAGIFIMWTLLGGGTGSFDGESRSPSTVWVIGALVFGFIAAFLGGMTAAKVGQSFLSVKILLGLMLVLGLVSALGADRVNAKRAPVDKPVAELTFMEAGQHAVNPAWYNWVIPIIGAAGAWLGGRDRRS